MNYYDMVKEFHIAMGQPVEAGVVSDMRASLIKEERMEFLKEACDLVYVLVGQDVEYGDRYYNDTEWILDVCASINMNFNGAFAEVHRSNMSKLDDNGKPVLRADGKILKGANYSPADMSEFV